MGQRTTWRLLERTTKRDVKHDRQGKGDKGYHGEVGVGINIITMEPTEQKTKQT